VIQKIRALKAFTNEVSLFCYARKTPSLRRPLISTYLLCAPSFEKIKTDEFKK
jgi:hypothetical protein